MYVIVCVVLVVQYVEIIAGRKPIFLVDYGFVRNYLEISRSHGVLMYH